VAVVPLDRGDRCGSNGGSYIVVVAVLAEIWQFEMRLEKMGKNCGGGVPRHGERACGVGSGSGGVAVVSLDRGDQRGSNGTR
jgi:hypothetical protein